MNTPQRTQVIPQQSWPYAPPPQYPQHAAQWRGQQQWPAQQWPQQGHPLAQQGWPQPLPASPGAHIPSDQKNAVLIAFAGALVLPIVLPLVILLIANGKPFQRAVALQALVFQIATTAFGLCVSALGVALLLATNGGFVMALLLKLPAGLAIVWGVAHALLGMAASQRGKVHYAPLLGRHLAKTFRAEWPD